MHYKIIGSKISLFILGLALINTQVIPMFHYIGETPLTEEELKQKSISTLTNTSDKTILATIFLFSVDRDPINLSQILNAGDMTTLPVRPDKPFDSYVIAVKEHPQTHNSPHFALKVFKSKGAFCIGSEDDNLTDHNLEIGYRKHLLKGGLAFYIQAVPKK